MQASRSLTYLALLFSAGRITTWEIPYEGIEYTPVKTWMAHSSAVRDMAMTFRHMLSVGDDGLILFHDLATFDRIRKIDWLEWCSYRDLVARPDVKRALKCISVLEDAENGGTVAVGTSYGDLAILSIGTNI